MQFFHDQPLLGKGPVEVKPIRLIRKAEVLNLTALSNASLYRLIKAGGFPTQVRLTECAAAWIEAEVMQWIADRIAASRGAA